MTHELETTPPLPARETLAWIVDRWRPLRRRRVPLVLFTCARAFLRVAENAFNYSLLGADGFTTLAKLTGATRAYDFSYGALDDAVAVFDALAEGTR